MLDEFRSTNITWDKATSRIYSPVTANASDSNGRKLNIQVVNSGQVENLTGATLHLYWETKDKAHDGLDAFDASDISKGEFELFYTTGMLSNVGELNATLVLVDNTGKVVSDWFKITVTRGINEGAIESENSFSSLTQALIDVSNLEQNYTPRLNDLTAQLQQTEQELNAQLAQKAKMLEDELTFTVGSDGDFSNINDALKHITKLKPVYRFNANNLGVRLLLKSGFIMQEQVFVQGLDLSFVSILSEDDEVIIDRQYLTVSIGSVPRYPAFVFTDGAISPKIFVLFNMNGTGTAEGRNGFNVRLGATILLQKNSGCKNAGGRGLHSAYGFGYANGCDFSGAGNAGIRVANGGRIFADGCNVSNSLNGFLLDDGYITAPNAIANNCGTAIRLVRSDGDFDNLVANDCGEVLSTTEQSRASLLNATGKRAAVRAITSSRASETLADFADFSESVGSTVSITNSKISARSANLRSQNDISVQATASQVDVELGKINRVFLSHGTKMMARNADNSGYTGTETVYNLSGRGNKLIADGTTGSIGVPINQVNPSGIVYK